MRVIILRNTLAPVVTVEMNFLVGGNETPPGFPGMAHAQEHMAFRGCRAMSADQTAAIYAELGGQNNADTQQNITQYFATVPAADLEVALRAQAACLEGVDDSNSEWAQERGAIEQEVARDLSNPTYKFIDRLNRDMFAGTPYAHDPLGTKASFDATTGDMLKSFYRTWYAPGAAILVIVGDVDPAATLDKVRRLFGAIPSHPTPPRPRGRAQAGEVGELHAGQQPSLYARVHRLSLSGNELSRLCGRPGARGRSQQPARGSVRHGAGGPRARGGIRASPSPTRRRAWAMPWPRFPRRRDAKAALAEMRKILEAYALEGVPEELVTAAKRREVADAEFERNSIPGLANVWSNAIAAEGRASPDEDVEAIQRVTLADVNRVARRYLAAASSITATLRPVPSGQPVATKGFGGAEQVTAAPTAPVQLPPWASADLTRLEVPSEPLRCRMRRCRTVCA